MSDSNNQQNKYPDEFDHLLQKVEEDKVGITDEKSNLGTNVENVAHRKSYSIDIASASRAAETGGAHPFHRPSGRARPLGHRKNKSSISELYDAIRSVDLEPIREDFRQTGRNLKTNFVKRVDEMDRGETGFFDMTMTRSLSVLPENIADLAHEAGVKEEEPEDEGPPLFQFFMLLSAVVGISSNATALHHLNGVTAPMKLFWRMSASYFALAPLALHYFLQDGIPKLSFSGWLTFVAAILCFSAQNCLYYSALEYTTIGNAVIYANSQALLLIIGKGCMGHRIHLLEGFGVVIAFTGAILCSKDSESASEKMTDRGDAIYGDLMALVSAVCGVAYLTFAKAVRSEMSVTVFIFCVMFFGSFAVLAFVAADKSEPLSWDANPYDGVFGGFNLSENRLPILIYLAVVCNMVGTMGFVRAMEYFDTVVIAVATLMEPLMASLIAYAFHAGLLPGPLGWLGNFLVVVGTLTVVYPSMGKGESMH